MLRSAAAFSRGSLSVLGAPISLGQPRAGVDTGPAHLRDADLVRRLERLGWDVNDRGDVPLAQPSAADPEVPGVHNGYSLGVSQGNICAAVREAAAEDDVVLLLGGDHGVAHGSISGVLSVRPETGVVWVDAHADINTPLISPSGNFHGMPVGFLMQQPGTTGLPGFEAWMGGVPALAPEKLVYVGLRDVDDGERALLRELSARGAKAFGLHEVDKLGIGGVMEQALDHLGDVPLHLSYDIDALDPHEAPATGTTVHGGLTLREGHFVSEAMAETGRLRSMDMVEVNVSLACEHGADRTVELACELTLSAMGKTIL